MEKEKRNIKIIKRINKILNSKMFDWEINI